MAELVLPHIDANSAGWVRFSLPLPEGACAPDVPLALTGEDGVRVPLQTKPLAYWRDGSARWLDCQARVESVGRYAIETFSAEAPAHAAEAVETSDGCRLNNGIVSLELSKGGESPVSSIQFRGEHVAQADRAFEASVRAANTGNVFTSAEDENRTVRIIERGPVRAVAEVEGRFGDGNGGAIMTWRLRVELMAGLPQFIVRHTFLHMDPNIDIHRLGEIAVRTRWHIEGEPVRHLHQTNRGMLTVPHDVTTRLPVDIHADPELARPIIQDTACLHDDTEYPRFMPRTDFVSPLLGLKLPGAWVSVFVDDFTQLCPSGLSSDADDLTVKIWPSWADGLELPQGRSRRTDMHFVFSDADDTPQADAVLAAVSVASDNADATLPADWYEICRCWQADELLAHQPAEASRWDAYLAKLATLPTVIGMWDLGDTIDPGYSLTYAALGRLARREVPRPYFSAEGHCGLADWSHTLLYEPVWTNNEYDGLIALCREHLRGGGSPALWKRIRRFARHAIEVDFVHYSDHPQLHHGTPAHSARHGKGTSYPSHLWCEGLLAYYTLTGDEDALDAVKKMGDFIIRTFDDSGCRGKLWRFNRELGWALLYLAAAADLTGEERFLSEASDVAERLTSEPITPEMARDMTVYSFGYASIALGVEALWRLTREQLLAEWLVRASDAVAEQIAEGVVSVHPGMTLNYLNAGFAVTRDARYIEAGLPLLNAIVAGEQWTRPPRFTKPMATLYRGLSRFTRYLESVYGMKTPDAPKEGGA